MFLMKYYDTKQKLVLRQQSSSPNIDDFNSKL